MLVSAWLAQLKRNGYRLTNARKAVVNTMATARSALNPLDVYEQTKSSCPGLGLVTVYRTLEKLEELHLIQRVHQPGGCNAYLPHADGHQHLIICKVCGKAEYFDGDNLDSFFLRVGREHGFTVEEHWLQLFGSCSECKN